MVWILDNLERYFNLLKRPANMKQLRINPIIATLLVLLVSLSGCGGDSENGGSDSNIESITSRGNAKFVVEDLADGVIHANVIRSFSHGTYNGTVLYGNSGTATVTGDYYYKSGVYCGHNCIRDENDTSLTITFDNYRVMSADNTEAIITGTVTFTDDTWSQQLGAFPYTSGGGITVQGSDIAYKVVEVDGSWGYSDTITFSASGKYAWSLSGWCQASDGNTYSFKSAVTDDDGETDNSSYENGEVPISDGAQITNSQIKRALQSGQDVKIRGAQIEGDIYLISDEISGNLDFTDTTFLGDVVFDDCTFKGTVDFTFTKFMGNAYFNDVTFKDHVSFRSAAIYGEISFMGARFESNLNCFIEATGGCANFRKTEFKDKAYFGTANFLGCPVFTDATFEKLADFAFVNFHDNAVFSLVTFHGDADFQMASFWGDAVFKQTKMYGDAKFFEAKLSGNMWPPSTVGGGTDLVWDYVKHTIPNQDRSEAYAAWETFFSSGGQYGSARQVRTASQRYELRPFVYSLSIGFLASVFGFAGIYCIMFWRARRRFWAFHLGIVFLFSLDVLTPGIGPWKHDWKENSGLPVEKVAILTGIQSGLGWILLTLGSAVAIVWLTA